MKITNPFEIYKLLPGTNCSDCALPNCLAFAAAVIKGQKKPADCPYIKAEDREMLAGRIGVREEFSRAAANEVQGLKDRVAGLDLGARARLLGGTLVAGKLAIKSLGKDFFVDAGGNITSECHTHARMSLPLLSYIIQSSGAKISGSWVPFRELAGGSAMNALFVQRSEKPLKQLIDANSELLGDIIGMFSGKRADNALFDSDMALSLYPLPKVPVLICYWKEEGDLESELNIFFDASADKHLKTESIFSLGVGLVMMFDKISRKHV